MPAPKQLEKLVAIAGVALALSTGSLYAAEQATHKHGHEHAVHPPAWC